MKNVSKEEELMLQWGQELAAKCNFSKDAILAVAFNALTDANFHEEAAVIMQMD